MKILTNNARFTYADIVRPTDYEKWERKEMLKANILEIVTTFASAIVASAMLIGMVFLSTLM